MGLALIVFELWPFKIWAPIRAKRENPASPASRLPRTQMLYIPVPSQALRLLLLVVGTWSRRLVLRVVVLGQCSDSVALELLCIRSDPFSIVEGFLSYLLVCYARCESRIYRGVEILPRRALTSWKAVNDAVTGLIRWCWWIWWTLDNQGGFESL